MNTEHPQTQYSEETGKHHTEYKPETSETVYSDEYVQWLEAKVQAQKPEPEVETGFVFQQVSQTLKIVADELKLANSRLGWKDSEALTRALEWQRRIYPQ